MQNSHRLSFSTLGCPGWSLDDIRDNAAAMGFSAVEIRGVQQEMDITNMPAFAKAEQARTMALFQDSGLSVCCVDTSVFLHDEANRETAMLEGKNAISLCKDTGVPYIRVFGDCFPPGRSKEEVLRFAAAGLAELAAFAGGDVTVLVEVHGAFNTIETLSSLLEQASGTGSIGLIWDIEHSYRAYGNDIEPFYRALAPFIRHVHIKDCVIKNGKASLCPPGEGGIDIEKIVNLLERGGFSGLYSFEWEKRWVQDLAPPETVFPQYVSYMSGLLQSEKNR